MKRDTGEKTEGKRQKNRDRGDRPKTKDRGERHRR
jgi:hypothetical protein